LFDTWPATAPILLVEGEKAALALQTRGAYALGTVTGAAAIPSSIVLAPLANRRLVLWPDNDDPGVQHMTQLGKRLIEIGATCRWFTWTDAPGGGDAADYLVTRTLANLKIDLAQAYRWPVEQNRVKTTGITAAELQRKTFDPLRWMVEGIVPEGALLIAGRPKSKKSWLRLPPVHRWRVARRAGCLAGPGPVVH
jgi:DNA primase